MRTCGLGVDQEFRLAEPLDAWAPQAMGETARVFTGFLGRPDHTLIQYAVKVMRPDQHHNAPVLFNEEALILRKLQDIPGVTRLVEYGFIRLNPGIKLPEEPQNSMDPRRTSGYMLKGAVERLDFTEMELFQTQSLERASSGWLPYLALERRRSSEYSAREQSLLAIFDPQSAQSPGSTTLGLQIAAEICRLLAEVHNRDIWYRDHKPWHYIWHQEYRRLYVIDWNRSEWVRNGLSEAQRSADLTLFGVCSLYYILTGRTHPLAHDIWQHLSTSPQSLAAYLRERRLVAHWQPGDMQRLPNSLRLLVENLLAGAYCEADALRQDLLENARLTQ